MKIQWATEAQERWRETALYIHREWGVSALKKFMDNTEKWQTQLESFPIMGKIEPLLADRTDKTYRSLVISEHNKMIYYISDETIWIVDFWDTRREPEAQAEEVK